MEYTNIESITFILDIIVSIVSVAVFVLYVLDMQPKKKIYHVLTWTAILIASMGGGSAFFLSCYTSGILCYRSNMMAWHTTFGIGFLTTFGIGAITTFGIGAILGIVWANRKKCK